MVARRALVAGLLTAMCLLAVSAVLLLMPSDGDVAVGGALLVAGLLALVVVGVGGGRSLTRAISRLRGGALQLSRAVDDLRLATKEAATATAQQSTAVVETSVTIEQLAAAATAIA